MSVLYLVIFSNIPQESKPKSFFFIKPDTDNGNHRSKEVIAICCRLFDSRIWTRRPQPVGYLDRPDISHSHNPDKILEAHPILSTTPQSRRFPNVFNERKLSRLFKDQRVSESCSFFQFVVRVLLTPSLYYFLVIANADSTDQTYNYQNDYRAPPIVENIANACSVLSYLLINAARLSYSEEVGV